MATTQGRRLHSTAISMPNNFSPRDPAIDPAVGPDLNALAPVEVLRAVRRFFLLVGHRTVDAGGDHVDEAQTP
jgi:hypothetical protein